ncbi:MAG: hypothetical protein S4CHLAM37_07460 [Chlamydiia bacterium]|nr:hypothetical protein [Chlamydiia bacterium]
MTKTEKSASSATSVLSKILKPVKKGAAKGVQKVKGINPDGIQKATNPNIGRAYINAIDSAFFKTLFRAVEMPKNGPTTFAKSHYFPTGKPIDKEESEFLVRERFEEEKKSIDNPRLLFSTKYNLNSEGTLHMTPTGLAFLKVDEKFVDTAYPHFYSKGAEKPPFIAHIPVISEDEMRKLNLKGLKEIGETFKFTVVDCVSITPSHWNEMDTIWALTVKSEELEHFREKYGLTSRLHSQDFIIVVAIKPKSIIKPVKEKEQHYLRVNPATSRA